MSIRASLGLGTFVVASLTLAAAAFARTGPPIGCGDAPSASATLELRNHTDCPIYVYLDGDFVGRCDPFFKSTIRARRGGEVVLMGRYRCDTWGPRTIRLRQGGKTTWTFTHGKRIVTR